MFECSLLSVCCNARSSSISYITCESSSLYTSNFVDTRPLGAPLTNKYYENYLSRLTLQMSYIFRITPITLVTYLKYYKERYQLPIILFSVSFAASLSLYNSFKISPKSWPTGFWSLERGRTFVI